VKPDWLLKQDPEKHPVRFLAGVWKQRMATNFGVTGKQFTPKEMGQLKSLRKALGAFSLHVLEWMLVPDNWWHFCQQVRVEAKLYGAPDYPHVGFLLVHFGRGLRIMRWALWNSTATADISFVQELDGLRYEQMKALALVYADGVPEQLAKIEAAKTLTDIQRVFIEIVDESITTSK
jgi:hypothetical protein